jgi:hypothetical protein
MRSAALLLLVLVVLWAPDAATGQGVFAYHDLRTSISMARLGRERVGAGSRPALVRRRRQRLPARGRRTDRRLLPADDVALPRPAAGPGAELGDPRARLDRRLRDVPARASARRSSGGGALRGDRVRLLGLPRDARALPRDAERRRVASVGALGAPRRSARGARRDDLLPARRGAHRGGDVRARDGARVRRRVAAMRRHSRSVSASAAARGAAALRDGGARAARASEPGRDARVRCDRAAFRCRRS